MLPDLPMPGATDPSTACETPIKLQALADSCSRGVNYKADGVFEPLGAFYTKSVKPKDTKLALEEIG